MEITYKINQQISVDEFVELLFNANLKGRHPVADYKFMAGLLSSSNLIVSAWHKDTLVGIARCVTNFHYACYLSDLAVSRSFKSASIEAMLLQITRTQLQARCRLFFVADFDSQQMCLSQYQPPLSVNETRYGSWVLNPN